MDHSTTQTSRLAVPTPGTDLYVLTALVAYGLALFATAVWLPANLAVLVVGSLAAGWMGQRGWVWRSWGFRPVYRFVVVLTWLFVGIAMIRLLALWLTLQAG